MPEDLKDVDPAEKTEKKKQPRSRKYNPKSLENLRQFNKEKSKEEKESEELLQSLVPEVMEDDKDDGAAADEIVRGKRLSRELILRLIPKKDVFTPTEKTRFIGIVVQYLSDFKEEEPTASDVDDIFEIAKSDVLEMRVLSATRNDPAALLASSQFLEKNNKRKQIAKENLSARRTDRRDPKAVQGLSIIDLVVNYDLERKKLDQSKIQKLAEEEALAAKRLREVVEKDG